MEPMFTIKPSLRLNMEGITALDTRRAPKVFSSNVFRIWSMVASATGPSDKVESDQNQVRSGQVRSGQVRSGPTNSQSTCVVHENINFSSCCKDGLHCAFNIIPIGYVQNVFSNVWVLKSLHAFEPSGRCIYNASSRSEFLASVLKVIGRWRSGRTESLRLY